MSIFSKVRSAVAGGMLGFRAAFSGWSFSDATSFGPDRSASSLMWLMSGDTRQYVDSWSRQIILRKVEWLFQNFGVVKEATRGIARLTVGKGICLQLNTDDEEWNALAEADFEKWALSPSRCDISGRRNFYEIQTHAVVQRIKAGEFLAAFVRNPRWDGEPCLQLYDPLEIESPGNMTDADNVVDGVQMDANHCPTFYHLRGLDGKFTAIPASEMIHWYFADATNQVRGVSEFAQAVAPLQDAKELARIVTKTAKQNSAIGLHIKRMVKAGGQGAIDKIRTLTQRANVQAGNQPGSNKTAPNTDPDPAYERLVGGGAIIYTDDQGEVKFLEPKSPSPNVEPFITKVLMRDGLSSSGAPAELFWDCANLNSANQRFVLVKGDALFTSLADGAMNRLCDPAAVRYLQHRMDIGKLRKPRVKVQPIAGPSKPTLPDSDDAPDDADAMGVPDDATQWKDDEDGIWMQHLTWQGPARLSIDNGRDAAAEISQLNSGIETLSTINDRRGRGWRQMTRQWFREFAFAYRCAAEAQVPWALKFWRAAVPGSNTAAPEAPDPEQKPEPEPAPTPAQS